MKKELITLDELRKSNINNNIDDSILMSSLTSAQDINLQTIIGEKLYEKLQYLVHTGNLYKNENNKYKILLQDYIHNFLKFQVLSEIVMVSNYKINNKGVVKNTDNISGVNQITTKDAQMLVNYYSTRASFYGKKLQDYLNCNDFAEYTYNCNTVYNCGIPLKKR